ncbi:MAG: arsenate reductase family protein [Syntrophomonadaceae bacterium]|nr:arsenate reductase family protein [Syntrophomonadaceae bacterium]
MLFVCYPQCTTCQKARKWLDDHGMVYDVRNIKTEKPARHELRSWFDRSGLPIKRFWNTSGMQYRELKLKDRLPKMNEDEQLDLLATDGMLVKRPVLIGDEFVLVGFKEQEWESSLIND